MKLRGKTALITGGAVRMGRKLCESLDALGVHIAIHYYQSEGSAQSLKRVLDGKADIIQGDLNSELNCVSLVKKASELFGTVDILINNAAVFHKDKLSKVTEKNLLEEIWPNLFAPIFLTRAFAEVCGSGKIINMLDRRITSLDTSCIPYVLSKKSLAEFARLAALELAPNITVNGIAPGAILPPPGIDGKSLKELAGANPLERQCTEQEIADTLIYLLKNDAITGQIIYVDGGQRFLVQGSGLGVQG